MGCLIVRDAAQTHYAKEVDSTAAPSRPTLLPAVPEKGPKPVKATGLMPPTAEPGMEVAEAEGDDDLDWLMTSSVGRVSSPSMLGGAESSACAATNARHDDKGHPGVRVQILLDGGWRDCSEEEMRQICKHLQRGATQFTLHARGQNYAIDWEDPEGPMQTNVTTGKKRKLRLLDYGDEMPPPDDEGMDSARLDGGTGGSSSSVVASPSVEKAKHTSAEVEEQRRYGAQSKRGGASSHPFRVLDNNPHAQECFAKFAKNEDKLCGEWAVFYHSYSFAALIYEVHAAVGSVLFRFRSKYATLPRILVHEFAHIPDAPTLVDKFNTEFAQNKRDHHPDFRRVALSGMCSLASTGPEACTAMVFVAGYSCKDLSFRGVLENLLESCYVPKPKVKKLADDIIALSEKYGLDVTQFGGKPCKSGKAGHLLQIFIKRHLVDKLVYAAKPYGPIDEERMPISEWMNSNKSFQQGQARIVAHPKHFMQANQVRMYVASADPTFHRNRAAFQEELIQLLGVILGQPNLREKAATGIYGGSLPSWWSSEDQRHHAY